jgi:hypothetical protein
VAECFRQDARSAALAICMFVNWVANLALTIAFPYMASLLKNYVFLVFTAIAALAVVLIFKKVPETKNRSVEVCLLDNQFHEMNKANPFFFLKSFNFSRRSWSTSMAVTTRERPMLTRERRQ